MSKPKNVGSEAIADWDPYATPPHGVRIENLRRRGVDVIRFYVEKPSRRNQVLFYLPFVLAAPIVAWSIYVFWLELGGVIAAVLAIYFFKMNRKALTKRWTVSLAPDYLGAIAETGKKTTSFSKRIAIENVKGIEVQKRRGRNTSQLFIKTRTEKIPVGEELAEELTTWLKNYLVLELAGLSWRPIFGVNRSQSKSKTAANSNPLLLDQDLAIRLIDIFVAQAPEFVDKLAKAVADKDADGIRQSAHWLKAASANVGAQHMSDQCQLMQLYAMDKDFSRTDILFDDIRAKNLDVLTWLGEIRETAATTIAQAGKGEAHPSLSMPQSPGAQVDGKLETSDRDLKNSGPNADSNIIEANVLVVDDSAVSRLIAEECLRDVTSRTVFVEDGQEALNVLAKEDFDLILSDCEMAGIDGYEFARRLRKFENKNHRQPTPIIALTAHALKGDRARCIEAGMNDYMSKPFSFDELEGKVRAWLEGGAEASAIQQPPSQRVDSRDVVLA